MSVIRIRDKNGNIIDIPAIKGNDYILTEADKENIANKTAGLIQQAECIPIGSAENKLTQLVDKSITEVTAQDLAGATKIGQYAFAWSNLASITIPNSVTSIGSQAFYYCYDLTSVTIGSGVTSINDSAFYLCRMLPSINIPNNVTIINNSAFQSCSNLTSITIPDSVTSLGSYVFRDCVKLTNAIIGNAVPIIAASVFRGCIELTNVIIGNSVTRISNNAFAGCSSLTSLTIPSNVTSIDSYAFNIGSDTNKATITFLSTTPPAISSSVFTANYLNKIIVPAGSGEAYRTATNWAEWADFIEEASV